MRKTLSALLMAGIMAIQMFVLYPAAETETAGTIEWTLKDGVLSITGEGAMEDYGSASDAAPWHSQAEQIHTIEVAEGITSIGEFAFANCTATQVSLPSTCTKLGRYAFSYMMQLTELVLPEGLQSIEPYCFYFSYRLADVQIPETVTEIGDQAFAADAAWYRAQTEEFVIVGDGILLLYLGEDTEVTVPDTVKQMCAGVFTTPLYSAFGDIEIVSLAPRTDITKITLPDHITTLPSAAFVSLSALTEVVLPESLEKMGSDVFAYCTALKKVVIPNTVQSLFSGENKLPLGTFMGCSALEACVLPDGLTGADDGLAFQDCTALKKATAQNGYCILSEQYLFGYIGYGKELRIPEGISVVMYGAFQNQSIFTVRCPESLRYLDQFSFADCKMLTKLELNDGLLEIGSFALSGCTNLTALTIPASVTVIGDQGNCALTDIYGTPGTAAEQFAKENGITFHDAAEPFEPPVQGADMTLDYTKDGWYFGNSYEIFGSEYYLTDADRQRLIDHGFNPQNVDTAWNGSCVGLAVTVILAKNGVFSPSQLQNGAQSLSEVQASEAVQSFINYFQCMQGSDGKAPNYEPRDQQFYRMLQIAKNIPNGASPFLLTFATQTGSHGVVGYGQESGAWEFGGRTYDGRILVWDSNFPGALNEQACLYYDSETYAYCIPSYGVYMAEGDTRGGIISVCNDLDILNAYPYPLSSAPGDADVNGVTDISDAVLLARYLAEDPGAQLSEAGRMNADCDGTAGLDSGDVVHILRMIARLV